MSGDRPTTDRPVVAIRDLTVRYSGSDRDTLSGVGLELRAGERVGLVGATGAGRSTLCRVLNGIVPQLADASVSGEVDVGGVDPRVTAVPTMARVVGMAFDDAAAQLSQATVADEVALPMESLGVPYLAMVERMKAILAGLDLGAVMDRPPRSLSGGQQQRVLLASAIALRPRVLVLDEAVASLDPAGRADVLDLLTGIATADGTAILIVEHDTELLASWADRIVVLIDGSVAADGAPAIVLGDTALLARAGVRIPDVAAIVAALYPDESGPRPVTLADGIARLRADG